MPVRPKSIVQFEQVFWAIIVLSIVAVAVGWSDMMSTVDIQRAVAKAGMVVVYVPVAIGLAIQLLFWYFIARRGSVIAKWIYVVFTVPSALWSALGLAQGKAPDTVQALITGSLIVLQLIAVVLLFRADTKPWFGEDASEA